MFEDVVDRLLRDGVTPELILSCERGDPASALWTVVEDNGLTIAAAPEALGGVGSDWSDCFPIIAAAGRHAAPIPLVETLSVNLLLGQSGCDVVTGAASLGLNAEGQIVDGGFSGTVSGVLTTPQGPQSVVFQCSQSGEYWYIEQVTVNGIILP